MAARLHILVFVCHIGQPICDQNTARAYQAFVAPEGVIVCGLPAALPIVQSAAAPNETEYIKTRCVLRP